MHIINGMLYLGEHAAIFWHEKNAVVDLGSKHLNEQKPFRKTSRTFVSFLCSISNQSWVKFSRLKEKLKNGQTCVSLIFSNCR